MSTIAKLGEEKLQELYDSSSSYSDILRKMKLCPTGGSSRNTLKKYKIIWNIDTKKFKKNFEVLKKNHYKKLQEIRSKDQRSDLDLFKENSEYATYSIKKRIIKRQLIKYECEKCKNKGKWQGEDLGLQLDHINGKSNDHRLENLRFLCPNCHSQTPTFASRNRNPKNVNVGR